jgi:hypothetical protein
MAVSLMYFDHIVIAVRSSASGTVQTTTGATSQPPTFVDCGIVIEPKVSALPSIELNVSASMATASHANAASLPSNGLVATHGSSTCVGSTLNTAGDTTAVSNIQWCLPPTATSTNEPPINSAVRSFQCHDERLLHRPGCGRCAAVEQFHERLNSTDSTVSADSSVRLVR